MRIFSYDRTSLWKEEKVSNKAQWRKVRQRSLEDHGVAPQRFSDLGKSGGNDNRKAFQNLQESIAHSYEQGNLYVWRYDRIYRNTQRAIEFVELCHKHNIEIISIAEPLPTGSTSLATKKMFVQLLFINASMQRESTIENICNGLAYKKSNGKYLSSTVPFGYRLANGEVLQDVQEAAAVKRLFELYNTGNYGYKKLTEALTNEGYFFRNHQFKKHNIWSILDNTIYYGYVKGGSFGSYQGDFVPIIDETTFQTAQNIRETRKVSKVNQRIYPLRQKIICPNCGWKLSPKMQWNYSKTKRLHYYHCANRQCTGIFLNAQKIEKQVVDCLKSFLNRDEIYQSIITEVDSQLQHAKSQERLTNQQQKKRMNDVLSQFEGGRISSEELKKLLNTLDKQKKETSSQVAKKEYQEQLTTLLELKNQSIQKLVMDHVERITFQMNKTISGIYLKNIAGNIYSEK